jgi:DNA-binding MarR family transcriptional regulator
MMNEQINHITDNLFEVLPLVHRKLLRFAPDQIKNVSRPQLAVMRVLQQTGPVPISEVARRLLVTRPQMTALADQLIGQKLADRASDKVDRRVTNIKLTPKGRRVLKEARDQVRLQINERLAVLDETDLAELSDLLKSLKKIGDKLLE